MSIFYAFSRRVLIIIFWLFYRHKTFGQKHVVDGGALVASNHASVLDPPLIAASWPHELAFLAREGLFKKRWLAWLIRNLNAFPLSEEKSDLSAMRLVGKLVEQGEHVVIFPEGSRSWDDTLQPLKAGAAVLASRFQCPIVPCHISGAHHAWPRGQRFPNLRGRTACVFGSPIRPEEYAGLPRKERQAAINEALEKKLIELRRWYEAGESGTPP